MKKISRATILVVSILAVSSCVVSDAKAEYCNYASPSADAEVNYGSITLCLAAIAKTVNLGAGIFTVSRAIRIPEGGVLRGSEGTILMSVPNGFPDNVVVEVQSQAHLEDITILAHELKPTCCTSIVSVSGRLSTIRNVKLAAADPIGNKLNLVGLYFLPNSAGGRNVGEYIDISNSLFGVIFGNNTKLEENTLQNSHIHQIRCDAVTFVGPGTIKDSLIDHVGTSCLQKPIPVPGAAIYSLKNSGNVNILGNTIMAACGNAIDLVRPRNLRIISNTVFQRTLSIDELPSSCLGRSALSLVDGQSVNIRSNLFYNADPSPWYTFFQTFPDFLSNQPILRNKLSETASVPWVVRIISRSQPVQDISFDKNEIGGSEAIGRCPGLPAGLLVSSNLEKC